MSDEPIRAREKCYPPVWSILILDISRYDSRTDCWAVVKPLPKAVSSCTAVTLKGKIYVVGGKANDKAQDNVQKYNPATNSWELVKSLTVNRASACSVSDGVHIFAIGGKIFTPTSAASEFLNSCEKYDRRIDSWKVVSPMNEKRAFVAAAILKQQIFMMGGSNSHGDIASCEVYNIPLDTWSVISFLQDPRYLAGAAVIDNKIYVIGGLVDEFEHQLAVECYNEDKREWEVVSPMPRGRENAATCTLMLPKAFIDSCSKWR